MSRPTLRSTWLFAILCALLFLAAHAPFLARTLEDIDSVNFALALHRFDVAAHRPHPPGYPIFVAIGKVVHAALGAIAGPGMAPDTLDARTLAILGAAFGALLAFPLLQVFRMLEPHEGRARAALVVTLASPLLWFTASRPLSDVAGLWAASAAAALLLTAWRRQRDQASAIASDPTARSDTAGLAASGRLIVLGALVAGAAIGMRSQTVWLTVPVLLFVIADRAGRGAAGAVLGSSITFGLGVLAWAIPLVVVTGGPAAYVSAVTAQAGEDLSGVDMLATNPTPRRLLAGLGHTFLDPWDSWWLAAVVLVLAAVGVAAMLRRSRPALAMVVALSVPYAMFHLTFHETFTTRYALPLMPVVAYLAVRGLGALHDRLVPAGAVALAAASLALTVGPLATYARSGSPLSRAVADLEREAVGRTETTRVMMNHPFAIALRDTKLPLPRIPTVVRRQWLEAVKAWRAGFDGTIWFLAEPGPNGLERHHELALIDPAARREVRPYRWPFAGRALIGGARPSEVDWVTLTPPGWFAGQGWALTPNIAGVSGMDRRGPARGGVSAWIRRRPDAAVALIGGRNLGQTGAPEVRFDVSLDGRPLRSWRVAPQPGFFLETFILEPGALLGDGRYAELTISAEAADGSRQPVEASVEQFDLQPPSAVVSGFDRGWYEEEFNPATGRLWRWTSASATLRVLHADGTVRCRLVGESPLRYFDRPPKVTLRAGDRVLGELQPDADFTWAVSVPAAALAAAANTLTLTTDETFVPDERSGNGDRRRLGLRVFDLTIEPADAPSR